MMFKVDVYFKKPGIYLRYLADVKCLSNYNYYAISM